jgi:hypothetical protein
MKKLIAIAVVLALVAGAAFAVDIGGTVFGHVNVMQGATGKVQLDDDPVTGDPVYGDEEVRAGGGMDRIRIEGSGEAGDGKFGGWIRFEPTGGTYDYGDHVAGLAWWKPIDQFKLTIGGNPDGIWGKEGVTGWMFNQMPYDSGIASGSGNIWGWGETVAASLQTRFAFFHGYGDERAALEIKPLDMLGINIAIPFIAKAGETAEDVFKATIAQIDLNFDFGNIALTYNGESHFGDPALFVYYGGSFGALGLDVGIGYHMTSDSDAPAHPFFAGLGVKYASDAFGIKFRTALGIPSEDTDGFNVLFDVLPYFAINDNISAFLNVGLGIASPPKAAVDAADAAGADAPEAVVGWFINPYLRVGAEWGPTFYVGLQISSDGVKGSSNDGDASKVKWAIPVSLMVSF